jgi:hypothetical protein
VYDVYDVCFECDAFSENDALVAYDDDDETC